MKCFGTLVYLAAVLLPMHRLQAQNVVTDWNTIASTTIGTNGGKASVASGVWFATASLQPALLTRQLRSPPIEYW